MWVFDTWMDAYQYMIHHGWEIYQHRFGECKDPDLDGSLVEAWSEMYEVIPQFPHCDARVLHKPGECKYCDLHPDWQALREVWSINFTGHYETDKMVCPGEQQRGMGKVGGESGWIGNMPTRGRLPDVAEVKETVDRLKEIEQELHDTL